MAKPAISLRPSHTYMRVRHDRLARLSLHRCTARLSHKYSSTGSHGRARAPCQRHATYYERTKVCRSCDELQSQCTDIHLHTTRLVLTRWRWRPRQQRRRWMNDGRGHNADGLHRSRPEETCESSPASRIRGVHCTYILVCTVCREAWP